MLTGVWHSIGEPPLYVRPHATTPPTPPAAGPSAGPLPVLPYRKPTKGRDYWVLNDVLPDVDAVRERCLAKDDWVKGYPYTSETWPGCAPCRGLSRPNWGGSSGW